MPGAREAPPRAHPRPLTRVLEYKAFSVSPGAPAARCSISLSVIQTTSGSAQIWSLDALLTSDFSSAGHRPNPVCRKCTIHR